MGWKIYFFETSRDEKVVKEFVFGLQESTIAKVAHHIDLLSNHGPFLGMPYSKKIEKDLFELRTRGREEVRIFYTFHKNRIYLLHAFKKKTQKTPDKEIKIAHERKVIVENL